MFKKIQARDILYWVELGVKISSLPSMTFLPPLSSPEGEVGGVTDR
jgi:hypothetical protein